MRCLSIIGFGLLLVLTGCSSTYYAAMEKMGWEKRDLLKGEVVDARDAQQGASQEFKTTMERFKELTGFQGGDLETRYNKLKGQYESCESRANNVNKQIADVETVANDMFAEWKKETTEYQSAQLRTSSEQKLSETKKRYAEMIGAMKAAAAKMPPVLAQFKDQVMFLKHNLNAQAIASLQGTASEIQLNVDGLIKEMDAAIAEANTFIGTLK